VTFLHYLFNKKGKLAGDYDFITKNGDLRETFDTVALSPPIGGFKSHLPHFSTNLSRFLAEIF
jgi:hypothetical protein